MDRTNRDQSVGRGVKWLAVGLTISLAALAFAAQWGVVNNQLDNIGKRLDELLMDSRATQTMLREHERRLSTVEGRIEKRQP